MKRQIRQLPIRIVTLLFGLVLIAGCASDRGSRSISGGGGTTKKDYTEEDLHQDLLNYASRFDAVVRSTSSQIAKRTDEQEIRRRSLLWKIRLIPLANELAVHSDPQEAYLSLSLLTEMMKQYLTTGEGKNLFGDQQDLAREAALELEKNVLNIGKKFLSEKRMNNFRKRVKGYAKDHTIRGQNFSVESFKTFVRKAETQRDIFRTIVNVPLSPFNALQGVGSTPAAIHDVNETMKDMIEVVKDFPSLVRWQTELMLYNVENRETVEEILSQTKTLNATARELTDTVQNWPNDMQRLLKKSSPQIQQANEITKKLNDMVGQTRSLVTQIRETGQEWKPLIKTLTQKESKDSTPSSEKPDLKDYRKTIRETNRSVKNLQKLAVDVKKLLESKGMKETPTRLKSIGTHTEKSGRRLIDRAFLRAVQLLGLLFAALLLYRTLVYFLFRPED